MSSCPTQQQVVVIDNRNGKGGGPYTVQQNTPNIGDVTVTDTSSGNSFVIPAPVFCVLYDCLDKDTNIALIEGGGQGGGDLVRISIDGKIIATGQFLGGHASGKVRWIFDDIVNTSVFHATPIDTANRNALPDIQSGYLIYNSDSNVYQYYDGTQWVDMVSLYPITEDLVIGDFVSQVTRMGGTTTSLTNPSSGVYTFTANGGAYIMNIDVEGNGNVLDVSFPNELTINVDNSTNSRDRKFSLQMVSKANDTLIDPIANANKHEQTYSGNVTTIVIPGMSVWNPDGFEIYLR